MKLFLISQSENDGYDTYSDAIVYAEDEAEAKKIHPNGSYDYEEKTNDNPYSEKDEYIKADCDYGTWVKKKFVSVEYLGEAKEGSERGVVCSSFHAG